MVNYIEDSFESAKQLVKELCAIPSPSHNEGKKAFFIKSWFEHNGGKNVEIDKALNVICPYNVTDSNELIVMMAHTDTVFPDLEPFSVEEKDGKFFCPGVLDDTANLVSLLFVSKYIMENKVPLKYGFLFVANSCEEGLGNSKGCRELVSSYKGRIRHLITVDGTNHTRVVNKAVGSHRYLVSVKTEGGHSFSNFGNKNAIACLSEIITELYKIDVPVKGNSKTTFNVGTINGGTSVNTIASEASMLFEYRSDEVKCLSIMKEKFDLIIEKFKRSGLDVCVELLGDRPCGSIDPNMSTYSELLKFINESINKVIGKEVEYRTSSTDANVPLSIGIPAICIAGAEGGSCHTREEYLNVDSLKSGMELLFDFISHYKS